MPRTPHASPQTLRLFEALMKDPATRRYGYELSRETGLASGTLYPILMRLTEQGLLDADWEPSDQPGRPQRHIYRLTGDGVALARVRLADAEARNQAAAMTPEPESEAGMRRVAYRVLKFAVRGRRAEGGPWGEAALAEFDQAATTGEAIRWAVGGVRVAARERYAARPVVYRLAAAALVVVAATPFLVGVRYSPSGVMAPTIAIGSDHLIDRVAFRMTGIDHGDIVAFHAPDTPPGSFDSMRRVIGLPGDRIECRDGQVLRDGIAVDEPYLPEESGLIGTECEPVTVPDGALYVLGDRREVALDSRHWGVIDSAEITGRVIV